MAAASVLVLASTVSSLLPDPLLFPELATGIKIALPELTDVQKQILKPVFSSIDTLKGLNSKGYNATSEINDAIQTITVELKKLAGTPNDQKAVQYIYTQLVKAFS
ncbi:hypothetical protein H4219_006012 [Mycoemilia scoparia]|uniref:Uncharacterized protein n=1 Tax=Mycoemilia scoparia TaxID=417184 RepID=A0A9W8DNU7_9FUNG|nr:hypothetical protein H4219_006012 [Mycoemilia scoparia]